jgi:hypothetical protein
MGKYITILPNEIRPTQNYLYQKTFDKYLSKLSSNKIVDKPIPVFQLDENTKYGVLDGHHCLSAYQIQDKPVNVWVAYDKNDFIPNYVYPNTKTKDLEKANSEIFRRYDMARFYVPEDNQGREILSLRDLILASGISVTR